MTPRQRPSLGPGLHTPPAADQDGDDKTHYTFGLALLDIDTTGPRPHLQCDSLKKSLKEEDKSSHMLW